MGKSDADKQKDYQGKEDLLYSSSKSSKSADHNPLYVSESKAWISVKDGKPGRALILKLIQSEACENWFQELFLGRSNCPGLSIPKRLVSLDEKYLRRCLELMHINAVKGAPCALSVSLSSFDVGIMSDYVSVSRRNSLDAIDYRMANRAGDLVTSPVHEGIVGSIMRSNSMISILRSPLFQRMGVSDHGRTSIFENKRRVPSDYRGSPGDRLTFSPSQKHGKTTPVVRHHGRRSDSVQRSPISISSGLPMLNDQSSAFCLSPSDSQGMLQYTSDGGMLHFAFSLNDKKELYLAHAWKIEVTNDKALDYIYSFHLKPGSQRMFDVSNNGSDLIGKMKVSTSFLLSSNNSKVMETEFVLVGENENHAGDMHTMTQNIRRSRKLSRVMEVFRSGHSFKQRTPSIFGGTSAILEDLSAEKCLKDDLSENDCIPNLEIAAIVVKDHLKGEDDQKQEVGGWGLKFLKKAVLERNVPSSDASAPSESCRRNVGDCSTSMDIIIPAGPHGGPRTRNGGRPSSLIERWKSGGHCDCGGWDIGCPIKVLKASPRREEGWPSSEPQGNCESFDIFREGSKQGPPLLKVVNVHDGLYFVSFQSSSLSALQCFSIAVAIIHSQIPTLRPKTCTELI